MSTPTTPPGWYPDPSGQPGQRYFDGLRWTRTSLHTLLLPRLRPWRWRWPMPEVAARGSVHVVHVMLTFLTCGL